MVGLYAVSRNSVVRVFIRNIVALCLDHIDSIIKVAVPSVYLGFIERMCETV